MKKILSLTMVLLVSLTTTAQTKNTKPGKSETKATTAKDTTAAKKPAAEKEKPAAEKKSKKTSAAKIVTVQLPDKVLTEIAFDKDSATAELPFIPETVIVEFPDSDPTKYTLQINKSDNEKFSLSLKCLDGDTGCIAVRLSDVVNGKLTLHINKGNLLYYDNENNIISKAIAGNSLYLKLTTPKAPKKEEKQNPYNICGLVEKETQKEIPLDADTKADPLKFFCNTTKCKCDTCSTDKENDSCRYTTSPSPFNQLYLAPCLDKDGNAFSHAYEVIYDTRKSSNSPITYLKIQKADGKHGEIRTVIKERDFMPARGEGVVVRVIGPDTTKYSVEYEGEQLYLNQQSDFADAIQKAIAGTVSPDSTAKAEPKEPSTEGSDTKELSKKQTETLESTKKLAEDAKKTSAANKDQIKEVEKSLADMEGKLEEYQIQMDFISLQTDSLSRLLPTANILPVDDTLTTKEKEIIKKRISDLEKQSALLLAKAEAAEAKIKALEESDKKLAAKDSALQKQIDTIQTSIQKLDSTIKAGITAATVVTSAFKADLLSLQMALMEFNRTYTSIDTRGKQYADDLLCIKKQIATYFRIPVSGSADDLEKSLNNKVVLLGIEKKFYLELCNLIKGITAEYKLALNKKKEYSITSQHIPIPNDDIVNIRFKAGDQYLSKKLEWFVKCGFKIDFSAGIYVNGITDFDVFYRDVSLRYKVDSIFVDSSGATHNVYNGNVNDTMGRVVAFARKKVPDIGTGVYMHFYSRINKVVGLGGGFGITTNFVSTFRLLFGGSLLLSTGKNGRVALTAGVALGNQTILDKSVKGYSTRDLDKREAQIQNSVYDLPKFTTSTDKIKTTTAVGYSWFAGFSYNFATVTPKKN